MRNMAAWMVALILLLATPLAAQTASCGNAIRESGEECDDGNAINLDGCSAACGFEQNERMTSIIAQTLTSPRCTANAFGSAFTGTVARDQFQTSLSSAISSGSVSVILAHRNLDDLTGTNDPDVDVGLIKGTRLVPAGVTYSGDRDWWYAVDPAYIDGTRTPNSLLPGAFSGGQLLAGPGSANIDLGLGPWRFSSVLLKATTGAAGAPTLSTGANPPGHLASENLDPALTSYEGSGGGTTGELCGNIRAASLAATPILSGFVGCTILSCSQCYTASNTMLDVLVYGCSSAVIGQQIRPTQPDASDAEAPPVGGGPPYKLNVAAATRRVNGCLDKNLAVVPLSPCLDDAAFSAYLKYQTTRVIATKSCPDTPAASNTGPFCDGQTIQLTATGPSGTYEWAGPNGFVSTLQNPTIANATAADAGEYSVTVTVGGCASPAAATTVIINQHPATPVIAAPSRVLTGSGNLAASVAAHEGSTYLWIIANGAITSGQGSNAIEFTAGSAGVLGLGVTETAAGCSSPQAAASVEVVSLQPPPNVVATATSSTQIAISWTGTGGIVLYEVGRHAANGLFEIIGSTAANLLSDGSVMAEQAYVYKVRAVDGAGNRSSYSGGDLATAIVHSGDPLVSGVTPVRAQHVTELRTAVNAVRSLAGLDPAVFTDSGLGASMLIKALHITDLRSALDAARGALMLPPLGYTDGTLQGGTVIKAAHVQELRNGTK